jgi:hypothetical protein
MTFSRCAGRNTEACNNKSEVWSSGLPDGLFTNKKIPIWVKFGGPWNGKCYVLRSFGIFFGHLVYFVAVWYILRSFGNFFPFWYVWTKNNLATLVELHDVKKIV